MMPPTYHSCQTKPSAENAALTVVAKGARRGLAATKQRGPSGWSREQIVALAERPQTRRTLQKLGTEKSDHIPGLVWQIAIQYPK